MASSSSPWPENRCAWPQADFFWAVAGPHNFKNIGAKPGRMVVTVTPAGLEDFFSEIGTRLASHDAAPTPPTPEDIQKLLRTAPKYGVEIFLPHE